jgi:Fe-S-cluster containining protein
MDRQQRLHLLGQVDLLHRHFDGLSKEAFSKASCRKGCNACCQLLVMITRTEAELIIERNPLTVAQAMPQLRAQAQELIELAAEVEIRNDVTASAERLRDAWWKRRRTCALLAADGSCSIYNDRPFDCRQHAVASDPAGCASRDGKELKIRMNFVDHHRSELERLEAYRAAAGDVDVATGALPVALVIVSQQMERADWSKLESQAGDG